MSFGQSAGYPPLPGNEFSYSFGEMDQQSFQNFEYNDAAYPDNGGQAQGGYPSEMGIYDQKRGDSYMEPNYFVPEATSGGQGKENYFEDEPPLLEELGINPYHIMEKTRSVLNPLRSTEATILLETDLAGPFLFCVMFGFILLLSGKVHFGYIYGIGVIGCLGMYFLLNMMSMSGVPFGTVVSVLGYCLLPMVGLAGVNLFLTLKGALGVGFTALSVLWCCMSASKLFITALDMHHQQPLVAYPCALVYGVFALLAVF